MSSTEKHRCNAMLLQHFWMQWIIPKNRFFLILSLSLSLSPTKLTTSAKTTFHKTKTGNNKTIFHFLFMFFLKKQINSLIFFLFIFFLFLRYFGGWIGSWLALQGGSPNYAWYWLIHEHGSEYNCGTDCKLLSKLFV